MVKVYISSPYRLGHQAENVRRQMEMAAKLIKLGFNPYIPLLSHFMQIYHPLSDDQWIDIDLEWVVICNCLIRLPGESVIGDKEVLKAKENDMPVFFNLKDLVKYYKP